MLKGTSNATMEIAQHDSLMATDVQLRTKTRVMPVQALIYR